ncbi:MAG: hypothetical protein KAV82_01960 [Phycisphaerae bacterium]|nr:hypothetical protein [Phycisphaerae bacterium]
MGLKQDAIADRPDLPPQVRHLGGRLFHLFIPGVLLCVFAILFVGWEVASRHLFPGISTGLRHALLTAFAGVVTGLASMIIYMTMRRHQRRLSTTAEQLMRLLESYESNASVSRRFENPHLVHCRDLRDCERPDCPMHGSPGERCWQVMALSSVAREGCDSPIAIEQCHNCPVYRISCPNKLTELGESFNNVMFLLEEEAARVERMRAQMCEKQKMVAIGQMAAGIAHEVGNPLSSISSIVQMLKRGGADKGTVEQIDLIETHIQRISTTVRQLVSLGRPVSEQWERVDLEATLSEAVRLIAFDRRSRNVDISYDPPQSLPPTYALRGQLQQVFINLFLNALDAMPDGGKLSIRAQKRLRKVVVCVEDTGCGIAPEIDRRVFEPFFTNKEPGRGVGLGLAVSYNIIQKHGGQVAGDDLDYRNVAACFPHHEQRAHLRGERDGQGGSCPGVALQRDHPRQAVHCGQLRRFDRQSGGERVVRVSSRCVHRCGSRSLRVLRSRRRGNLVSRRDWGLSAGQSAGSSACDRAEGGHPRRRQPPTPGEHSHHGGHQPRSRKSDRAGRVS